MGPDSFTGQLGALAAAAARGDAPPLVLNVDGPYGAALDYKQCDDNPRAARAGRDGYGFFSWVWCPVPMRRTIARRTAALQRYLAVLELRNLEFSRSTLSTRRGCERRL